MGAVGIMSDLGPHLNLNNTMGMILLGLIFDTMLYGIMFFQTYQYFTSGARDRTSLRVLIAALWALDTLQLVLLCHAVYHFLILNYGRPDTLEISVWSLNLEIAPSVIATFMVRCFFTVRLWHLSQGNKTLIGVIAVFALIQLGIGLAMCVTTFQEERFSQLPGYKGLLAAQMSAATVADALITGSLLYYLNKSKAVGTRRTSSLINRLIVWTVNTALLTGVVEAAQVTSWISATKTLIFLPFHLIIAKIYTCSMLAMLNGRRGLRQSFDEPTRTLPGQTSIVISLHNTSPDPDGMELREISLSNSPHTKNLASALFPKQRDIDGNSSECSPFRVIMALVSRKAGLETQGWLMVSYICRVEHRFRFHLGCFLFFLIFSHYEGLPDRRHGHV
ncbi:hypothetical protein B0F90DRAFT_879476 [Multifurca ochricompacta]|uniref:DUF6534 domain-containing protein n=1 Tax=Multifurca ochricompacta TaxID=376703 RepID=A0AAD4M179_9AGAM|nr:hypothetical protein B0F90DRAFT_879476 [Multifurca ochricompacta]